MTRLGVVISGRGSNFLAIAAQVRAGAVPAEIAVVISNRADAPGLAAARELGLTAIALPSKGLDREAYDQQLIAALREHGVEWVILAGYMRILSAAFIRAFPSRILNIHPSLLPAFTGLDAQHQAAAVEVAASDTAETLSARILVEEHRIYSESIRRLLTTPWRIDGRRVVFET